MPSLALPLLSGQKGISKERNFTKKDQKTFRKNFKKGILQKKKITMYSS